MPSGVPRVSKKKAAAVPVEPPANEILSATTAEPPAAPPKKKAAAKKPVKVVAIVTPDGIEGSFTPEPRRPLIAHLQVHSNEIVFHDQALRYDPNPPKDTEPEPYDASTADFFSGGQEEIPQAAAAAGSVPLEEEAEKGEEMVEAVSSAPVATGMPCFTNCSLMAQFKERAEVKALPESTTIACFWCAHGFDWRPCVIPEREVAGVYTVYGNFCCPACAVAYLLNESLDPHVRWERMALLNRIYDRAGKGRIYPAPARESLQLFGGPMTIEQFRATVKEEKVRVDLHMPPMVSILGSIDTKPIDFFDTTLKGLGAGGATGVGVPGARTAADGGLRLKRMKPLKDRESTLDTVMNIQIGRR